MGETGRIHQPPDDRPASRRVLAIAFAINTGFLLVEVVGAWLAVRFDIDHATLQLEAEGAHDTVDLECYPVGQDRPESA